jgi:hypothetical protein
MKAVLSSGAALLLALSAADAIPIPATRPSITTQPATRPAHAASSRPGRANVSLSPEQLREYRAAFAQLQKKGDASIQAARLKLQEARKKQEAKYRQQQSKDIQKANQAARRENLDLRHRRAYQAYGEARKMQQAQADARDAAARHKESERDYSRTLSELGRLEKASLTCQQYALDLDYQQWHQAQADRNAAEALLARRTATSYSADALKIIEPIEQAIGEELRKLENRQDSLEP